MIPQTKNIPAVSEIERLKSEAASLRTQLIHSIESATLARWRQVTAGARAIAALPETAELEKARDAVRTARDKYDAAVEAYRAAQNIAN